MNKRTKSLMRTMGGKPYFLTEAEAWRGIAQWFLGISRDKPLGLCGAAQNLFFENLIPYATCKAMQRRIRSYMTRGQMWAYPIGEPWCEGEKARGMAALWMMYDAIAEGYR